MILIAACAFGLESPVKWELQKLGYSPVITGPGRIQFDGNWEDVAKTNLWLRIADRVLIEVKKFDAPDFDALFDTAKAIKWADWLPVDAKFPVTGRSRLSQLTSVPAIQRTIKKAIVESLLVGHQVEELPETGPEYRIDVAILNDVAALTIDTTGPSLHKRGYRTSFGEAPIKETLAAAMVMLSVWNPRRPLIDPFCGSGTIAIEAALIGRNLAPGRNRSFAWQQWQQSANIDVGEFDGSQLEKENEIDSFHILATDADPDALIAARRNAELACVAKDIHFQEKSFEDLRSKRKYGCIITNPPYGERISERQLLLPLYRSFPSVLQRLPTWSHFVITNLPDFEGLLHQSATRRRKLFNGRIECMFYQFLGPRPPINYTEDVADEENDSPKDGINPTEQTIRKQDKTKTIAPVFGGLTSKDDEQADLFATRLTKRARHFRRWPTKRGITCFRLYERDIPELPFVVDRYEDQFHMTEYERPHDRDPGRHAGWLELMKKTVAKTFNASIKDVHLKSRLRQAGNQQHRKIDDSAKKIVVNEGGLKFLVNLKDYVDTGLFLDHRKTRKMVFHEAKEKDFLNLFAYTGSFSVYAAAGGALTTTTVDWSNTYQQWARENMELNQFVGPMNQYVRASATEFVDQLPQSKKYDLVVVDPPTFSNSKRTDTVWDIQENHVDLLIKLSDHVSPHGTVYFSTNFRKFKFDAAQLPNYTSIEISAQTIPEDFRNKRIHRCWKLTRV